MNILLVQCPCSFGVDAPPLGLAYLSSYLKQNNYEVSILDLSIILYTLVDKEYKEYWKSNKGYCWYLEEAFNKLPFINENCYNDFVDKILSFNTDILGFSLQNTSTLFTLEVIKRIKSKDPSKKVILGGPNCYNVSGDNLDFKLHLNLQEFADVVIVGEGEQVLLNVLRHIESKKSLDECEGIAILKEKRWVFSGFASPVMNLDILPFPDFEAYNLNAYINKNVLPILTSRGCVMKCIFCTDTQFWRPYRYRSAKNVIMEIEKNKKKYKNKFFIFNDSLINGNFVNLMDLCEYLISRRVDISWGGNFRVDKRLNLKILRKIKDAGCDYLILGIESGSNRILGLMRKGFTIEEAACFIYDCKMAGINIEVNWITGFPGETEEDFMATVNFIKKYEGLIKRNLFSTLTINQFSYLENHKEEFGIILDGPHLGLWISSDGKNTIELRNSRLHYLESIEQKRNRDYGVVRQIENK